MQARLSPVFDASIDEPARITELRSGAQSAIEISGKDIWFDEVKAGQIGQNRANFFGAMQR